MNSRQLIAALKTQHIPAYTPWMQVPELVGWHVILCLSEYHPRGWSVRVSCPHRIINQAIASSFEALGYQVDWRENDPMMEAWPKNDFSAPVEFFESGHQDCDRDT